MIQENQLENSRNKPKKTEHMKNDGAFVVFLKQLKSRV